MDRNEGYGFEAESEMNELPSSCGEYGDDEEPCDGSYGKVGACEESYTSHFEPRVGVKYSAFICKAYKSYAESAYVEYEDSYFSPYSTSYQGRSGVNSYTSYSGGCPMRKKEHASPKPRVTTSYFSYYSAQTYKIENQGRCGGYSRSQNHHTLPIFIRESGPENYLDW
ncbi:hypothetical protein FXO38_04768 [Capsicum annuum]|nr:hypothetical protein FXO38_04768 [Capsicum annuum]